MLPRCSLFALDLVLPKSHPALFAAVVVIGVFTATFAYTCCMVPLLYPGDVDQARQDAVIFHDGTIEDLVLGVSPVFPEGERGPEKLLWIVTIPSPPVDATAGIEYAVIDRAIFADAQRVARRLVREQQRPDHSVKSEENAAGSTLAGSLIVEDPVQVGPYEITAVRGTTNAAASAAALNQFLDQRGYPTEPLEEVTWFTERNFTFLCIEITPPDGATHFSTKTKTPALRVSFPCDRVYYPAKYSARQGDFALGLTVFSAGPLEEKDLQATRTKLDSTSTYGNLDTADDLPGKLGELVSQVPRLSGVSVWYVTPIISYGFNAAIDGDVGAISQWEEDVFLEIGPVVSGSKVVGLFATIVIGSALGGYLGLRMRRRAGK
ncbi:MAG: DUF2330 domain-containing protein [Planctomycetota bacterium]